MQRRKLILLIKISVCFIFLFVNYAKGQVVFNINSTNIKQAGAITVDNATTVYTAPFIGIAPTITLKTSSATLAKTGGGTGLAANLFTSSIIGTGGGLINVLNIAPTITLSTTAQTVYSTLLSVLPGGAINFRYSLTPSSNIWLAGAYSTNLNFAISGINPGTINPTTAAFNVNVDAFVDAVNSISTMQLSVNSLSYYRNTTLSGNHDLTVTTTVPYGLRVKANSANFSYTNGYTGSADLSTLTNLLNVKMTTPIAGNLVSPGTTFNDLSTTGLSVPTGNQQSNTIAVSVSPANLKSGFLQQGTYSATITYEAFDSQTSPLATKKVVTMPLTLVVNDLSELKVNQTDVNLIYNNATDYANGVHTDVSNHVTFSKTTAYDVYVKANTSTLTNGSNSIPVDLITVSPSPGYAGSFNTVNLSSTYQKLISAAAPVVDRTLNVRYAIPNTKTSQLLGKVAGIYSTVVTYSIIAP